MVLELMLVYIYLPVDEEEDDADDIGGLDRAFTLGLKSIQFRVSLKVKVILRVVHERQKVEKQARSSLWCFGEIY